MSRKTAHMIRSDLAPEEPSIELARDMEKADHDEIMQLRALESWGEQMVVALRLAVRRRPVRNLPHLMAAAEVLLSTGGNGEDACDELVMEDAAEPGGWHPDFRPMVVTARTREQHAEIERLKALVESAYREGYAHGNEDGYTEYDPDDGWDQSAARAALDAALERNHE